MDEPKPPPGDAPAAVRTFSAPERPAYLLVLGFLACTAGLVILLYGLVPEEGGTAELVMLLTGLAVVALAGAAVIQTLTVRLEADAGGLTVSMGHLITRRLPWAAVAVVEEAPRGGSTDVGWKMMGGGRVGYLAGAETVLVKIRPEFRTAARAGEITVEGSSRLAEWYYISAPDAGHVAAQLEALRRASPSHRGPG